MEVELRDVLVRAAVGDQAVAFLFEAKLLDQAPNGTIEVDHEFCVGLIEIGEAANGALGQQQDVQGVAGAWMVKGQQVGSIDQPLNRDYEAHMCTHKTG